MKSMLKLTILILIAVLPALQDANAQTYPSRAVRIILPTPAGGPGDIVARGIAQALGQVFGQPFVVENRLGAESIVGVEACVRSISDGHTLCSLDSFAVSLNPVIHSKLSYDPDRDLAPIIQYGTMGSALSVHPSVPANSVRELLELAKAKPNTIPFGTFGLASSNQFYVDWLKNAKGIAFLNVPYKAASQAMKALLSGEIQVVAFSLAQSLGHAKAGKVKILAVAGDERSRLLPSVPSFKEEGIDVSVLASFGMFAPGATPRPIIQRLNAEIAKILPAPPFKEKFLSALGIEMTGPAGGSTEAFAKYIKQQRDMYAELVKVVGLKVD